MATIIFYILVSLVVGYHLDVLKGHSFDARKVRKVILWIFGLAAYATFALVAVYLLNK